MWSEGLLNLTNPTNKIIGGLNEQSYQNKVELKFIQPGKPVQNAYIESFNGKFRDECLNQHWFSSSASHDPNGYQDVDGYQYRFCDH